MNKTETTKLLLHSISAHISSRAKLRKVEYIFVIDNQGRCYFKPPTEVFPNRQNKRKANKLPLLNHVIPTHMDDIYLGTLYNSKSVYGIPVVDITKVHIGEYKYKLSFSDKTRRWVRIK